jgi:hypothetical protein
MKKGFTLLKYPSITLIQFECNSVIESLKMISAIVRHTALYIVGINYLHEANSLILYTSNTDSDITDVIKEALSLENDENGN